MLFCQVIYSSSATGLGTGLIVGVERPLTLKVVPWAVALRLTHAHT